MAYEDMQGTCEMVEALQDHMRVEPSDNEIMRARTGVGSWQGYREAEVSAR
jgi:hypothetical protein